MAGKSLGTLTLDLIARVGGFVGGLDRAERASDEWRRQVQSDVKAVTAVMAAAATATLGVGAAGIRLLQTTSAQITETDRQAKSLNIATQELIAWQYAAEKAGLSGENMGDIFKDLGDKIGDAVINQSGEAVDALNTLGLSAAKLSKVSPDKQLLAIGEAIGKIETNAGRINILESLGNDLSKMLPLFDNNNEKLKEFLQLSKDYGVAPDQSSIDDLVKVNALFEDMETQAKALKMEIATGLAKVDVSPLQKAMHDLKDIFTDPKVLEGLVAIVNQVAQLAGYMGEAAKLVKPFLDQIGGSFELKDDASESEIKARVEWLKEARKYSDNLTAQPDIILNLKPSSNEIDNELAHWSKILNSRKAGAVINLPVSFATVGDAGGLGLAPGESNGKPDNKAGGDAKKVESAFKAAEQGYLRQIALIDKVNGKTKETTELQKIQFDINDGKLKGLNEAQKLSLESLATEIDRLHVLGQFKDLQIDLFTPEEKLLGITKERVKLLREAKGLGLVNDDDYQKAAKAIAGASFTAAPHFEGIDPMFGGQSGELRKVDEAQKELETWYQTQLNMLEENRKSQSELNEQWDAQELALRKKHQEELDGIEQTRNQLMLSSIEDGLGSVVDITKTALGEQSGLYKAAFVAQKAAAIAQSTIAISQGMAMAAANPFPLNLAAIASVAAATAGIISSIQSVSLVGMAHDGMDSVPETGTWLLQKGERVTTAATSAKLDATLDRVSNQSAANNTYQPSFELNVNGNPDSQTIAMIEQAVKRGAAAGYQMVSSDLAKGSGNVSKALGGGWATKRKVS